MEKILADLTAQIDTLTQTELLIMGLAVICYIPLIITVLISRDARGMKNGAGQNFYTWILWLSLDIIQCTCTLLAGGTYVQFLAFIPCAALITLLLVKYKKKMSDFEKIVLALVSICIGIWIFFGKNEAIIFETICQVVAGLPLLKDTWKKPEDFKWTLIPLSGFVLLYIIILNTIPNFSFEHALFPTTMLIYTSATMFFIIIPLFTEWKRRREFKKIYGRY